MCSYNHVRTPKDASPSLRTMFQTACRNARQVVETLRVVAKSLEVSRVVAKSPEVGRVVAKSPEVSRWASAIMTGPALAHAQPDQR